MKKISMNLHDLVAHPYILLAIFCLFITALIDPTNTRLISLKMFIFMTVGFQPLSVFMFAYFFLSLFYDTSHSIPQIISVNLSNSLQIECLSAILLPSKR